MGRKWRGCGTGVALALALAASRALGSDWVGPAGGDWNVGSFWSPSGVPLGTFVVVNGSVLVQSDVSYNLSVKLGTAGDSSFQQTGGTFKAGEFAIGTGTVLQTGGVCTIDDLGTSITNGSYTINSMFPPPPPPFPAPEDDSVVLNTQVLSIGAGGLATFNQNNGTVNVASLPNAFQGSALDLGIADGNGTYNLTVGTLNADHEAMGDLRGFGNGKGMFYQTGGANNTAGLSIDGASVYELSGGTLTVGNGFPTAGGSFGVGNTDISGAFRQTGGVHQTDALYIDYGSYTLTTSELTVIYEASLFGDSTHTAKFEHTGGYVTIGAPELPGDSGTLSLSSYSLYHISQPDSLNPSFFSAAHVKFYGDGNPASIPGQFMQDGGTVQVQEVDLSEPGNYQLNDGSFSANSLTFEGFNAGTFTQSGGIASINTISMFYGGTVDLVDGNFYNTFQAIVGAGGTLLLEGGTFGGSNLYVGGTMQVSGGAHSVGATTVDGRDSGAGLGAGSLQIIGGSLTTQDMTIGATGAGSVQISGGSLATGQLRVGYFGNGALDMTGGTLTSGSAVVGDQPGSIGRVNLSGSALWTIAPDLGNLGPQAAGDGKISITGSAELRVQGFLYSQQIEVGGGGLLNMDYAHAHGIDHLQLTADQLKVLQNGKLNASGAIAGHSGGTTAVTNAGEMHVAGPYFDAGSGIKSQLLITGNFTQQAGGKTFLAVGDDNRISNPKGAAYIPMVITGLASLGGELNVDTHNITTNASNLSAGDRFNLVRFGDITSRFDSFNGTNVAGRADLFYGLNYVVDGAGKKGLNLVALSTPRLQLAGTPGTDLGPVLTNNNATGLVLITHGLDSSADGNWPQTMARSIDAIKSNDWNVVTVDWRQLANQPLTPGGVNTAAVNAIDVGQSLYFWMHENGLDAQYSQGVHLIGHSAGSWLVDGLADKLHEGNSTLPIFLTVLDPYTPTNIIGGGSSLPELGATPVLGDSATIAENIVDKHLGALFLLAYTNSSFSNFLNIDVSDVSHTTPVDPIGYTLAQHAWPYVWYQQVINEFGVPPDPNGTPPTPGAIWGISRSTEAGGDPNNLKPLVGVTVILHNDGTTSQWNGVMQHTKGFLPTALNSITSTTGKITFDSASVTLATGSPVILTSAVQLDQEENILSFGFQFLGAADGLLSVYLDDALLGGIDSQYLAGDRTPLSSGDIWLDHTLDPGLHTLIFRLDPDGADQAMAQISNIEFSFAQLEPVPEPAGALVFTVCVALGCLPRSTRFFRE